MYLSSLLAQDCLFHGLCQRAKYCDKPSLNVQTDGNVNGHQCRFWLCKEDQLRCRDNDKVVCVNQFVDQEHSSDRILSETPCPTQVDRLMIDIYGNNHWIWK